MDIPLIPGKYITLSIVSPYKYTNLLSLCIHLSIATPFHGVTEVRPSYTPTLILPADFTDTASFMSGTFFFFFQRGPGFPAFLRH